MRSEVIRGVTTSVTTSARIQLAVSSLSAINMSKSQQRQDSHLSKNVINPLVETVLFQPVVGTCLRHRANFSHGRLFNWVFVTCPVWRLRGGGGREWIVSSHGAAISYQAFGWHRPPSNAVLFFSEIFSSSRWRYWWLEWSHGRHQSYWE